MKAIRNLIQVSYTGDDMAIIHIALDGKPHEWKVPKDLGEAIQQSLYRSQRQNAAIYRAVKRKER